MLTDKNIWKHFFLKPGNCNLQFYEVNTQQLKVKYSLHFMPDCMMVFQNKVGIYASYVYGIKVLCMSTF